MEQQPPPIKLQELSESANRILFGPRQASLGEAILADLYDDVVGFIPFVGDAVTNVPRAAIAKSKGDEEAATVHGISTIVGVIPVIGDLLDTMFPANTLLKAREIHKCMSEGKSFKDCASGNVEQKLGLETPELPGSRIVDASFKVLDSAGL